MWNSQQFTSTNTAVFSSCSSPIRPSFVFLPWSLAALLQPSFWACLWSQISAYKLERKRAEDKVTEFRTEWLFKICSHELIFLLALNSIIKTQVIYHLLAVYH
jgi:hypothetical protein